MKDYNPKSWFSLIFEFHKSDTSAVLIKTIIVYLLYTTLVLFLELQYTKIESTVAVHSLLGFVIGLLLVFRTNTAYSRWWEGRQKWGELVNTSRNLAMKLNAGLPKNLINEREYFASMISNYALACKSHLRDEVNLDELIEIDTFEKNALKSINHKPNFICNAIFSKIHELYNEKKFTDNILITIDNQVKIFSDVLGSCERIKKTPIPYSYNIFIKKFIFIYTITLPFGLASDLGYWAIPVCSIVLYVLCSLELLAEEIEDPFGHDANDLPLSNLCKTIKGNVFEILKPTEK